jgi:predicted O-methyltransferase YrrM
MLTTLTARVRSLPQSVKRRLHASARRRMPWVQSHIAVRGPNPAQYDRLVADIRAAGTNSLRHFRNGYQHEGGLRLQQNPYEFASLVTYLLRRPTIARYFEIGSASGGAGRFLADRLHFGEFVAMDDGQHPDAHMQRANFAGIPNVRTFIGDSHSRAAADYLRATYPARDIDVAFIDGDHSAEGVAQDLAMTLPYCRPGAWVIFHDTIACEGVERAWLDAVDAKRLTPVAEFIGDTVPLGIAIGAVP